MLKRATQRSMKTWTDVSHRDAGRASLILKASYLLSLYSTVTIILIRKSFFVYHVTLHCQTRWDAVVKGTRQSRVLKGHTGSGKNRKESKITFLCKTSAFSQDYFLSHSPELILHSLLQT